MIIFKQDQSHFSKHNVALVSIEIIYYRNLIFPLAVHVFVLSFNKQQNRCGDCSTFKPCQLGTVPKTICFSSVLPHPILQSSGFDPVNLGFFLDCYGVVLTNYAHKGQTITGAYYKNLLTRLREAVKTKHRRTLSKGVFLLRDNAPAHSAQDRVTQAASLGYQILPHPLYSPDMAPSDFFLFLRSRNDCVAGMSRMMR